MDLRRRSTKIIAYHNAIRQEKQIHPQGRGE